MNIARLKKRLRSDSGAVMMEYVIIGLLIAVGCILAVVLLSRAVFYGFDTAQLGATGDSARVDKTQKEYRKKLDETAKDAGNYHDSLHSGK